MWVRDLEETIVPTCKELGIGIVAYSPLGRGMLTGTVGQIGSMDYRKMAKVGYVTAPEAQPSIERFKAIAAAKGVTPAQLALAWLIKHGNEMLDGAGCVPSPGLPPNKLPLPPPPTTSTTGQPWPSPHRRRLPHHQPH